MDYVCIPVSVRFITEMKINFDFFDCHHIAKYAGCHGRVKEMDGPKHDFIDENLI